MTDSKPKDFTLDFRRLDAPDDPARDKTITINMGPDFVITKSFVQGLAEYVHAAAAKQIAAYRQLQHKLEER